MQSTDLPTLIPVPFAASGGRNVIPVASQVALHPGLASFADGFPPLTGTPVAAGGLPPTREDFNGAFYMLSAQIMWRCAGGAIPYDPAFSAAVGGYPKGAIVASATTPGVQWLSTVEANSTNPDAGGAGWVTARGTLHLVEFNVTGVYSFTVPAGVYSVRARVKGGGGGGAQCFTSTGSAGSQSGGGGGEGGSSKGVYAVTPGQVISVAVGAGAGTQANGGTSSFGAFCSATGGMGASFGGGVGSSPGGGGGVGYGGQRIISGGSGSDGQAGAGIFTGNGGGAGGGRAGSLGGVAATGPGAGGGGAYDFQNNGQGSGVRYNGGAGHDGEVSIEYVQVTA